MISGLNEKHELESNKKEVNRISLILLIIKKIN